MIIAIIIIGVPIVAMVLTKESIGPTKSGRNFVINQQDIVGATQFADPTQVEWMIHAHTASTLDDRFNDHGRDIHVVLFECIDQFLDVMFLKVLCFIVVIVVVVVVVVDGEMTIGIMGCRCRHKVVLL